MSVTRFINAFLLDGRGGYQERSGLAVEGNLITSVEPNVADGRHQGETVIDLGGRTLLPGMINQSCCSQYSAS